MYTRSFFENEHTIPEGYDGEALRENDSLQRGTIQPASVPPKISPQAPPYDESEEEEQNNTTPAFSPSAGFLSSIFDKIPFKGFFEHLNIPSLSKIELEDIILIAVAIMLFFSESGDKMLAIMLAFLLFISKE